LENTRGEDELNSSSPLLVFVGNTIFQKGNIMSNVTKQFVLAGHSIFTIEIPEDYRAKNNLKPHYTFRVDYKAAEGKWKETWFVKYLTGSDNTRDYSYLGLLSIESGQVRTTAKSKLNDNSLVVKLLNRTLALIWADDITPMTEKGFGLHHEGRCGKCGRVLTTPTSISLGFGPECWDNMNGGNYPHLAVQGQFEDQTGQEAEDSEADIAERQAVRDAYLHLSAKTEFTAKFNEAMADVLKNTNMPMNQ